MMMAAWTAAMAAAAERACAHCIAAQSPLSPTDISVRSFFFLLRPPLCRSWTDSMMPPSEEGRKEGRTEEHFLQPSHSTASKRETVWHSTFMHGHAASTRYIFQALNVLKLFCLTVWPLQITWPALKHVPCVIAVMALWVFVLMSLRGTLLLLPKMWYTHPPTGAKACFLLPTVPSFLPSTFSLPRCCLRSGKS